MKDYKTIFIVFGYILFTQNTALSAGACAPNQNEKIRNYSHAYARSPKLDSSLKACSAEFMAEIQERSVECSRFGQHYAIKMSESSCKVEHCREIRWPARQFICKSRAIISCCHTPMVNK